ncbi:hypothetical protein PTNB85_07742 [Pyrenophora teres f. teres]|nr:hypothetical protein PTNB85_07742 [Pyrenophora teres f. teres]
MFSTISCNTTNCRPDSTADLQGEQTLSQISEYIESTILVMDRSQPRRGIFVAPRGFPLSEKTMQSAHRSTLLLSPTITWAKLLTGTRIQGPNSSPPTLSLAKSERELAPSSPSPLQANGLEIWYDIDSITFQATSLAVHRGSFKMYLAPNYLQTIRQNQKINIQGLTLPLHKTKHIALGHSTASYGSNFGTYLVFPEYPCAKGHQQGDTVSHLDTKSLATLYNQAILAAMKEECGTHVTQHTVASFEDAYTKAHVKAEIGRGGGNSTGMSLVGSIPEPDLDLLWQNITRRCETLPGPYPGQGCVFRNPILIVQAHDTKLDLSRRQSQRETFISFRAAMKNMFNIDQPGYINKENFWVDFAREIIPKSSGFTALGRRDCLEHRLRKGLQQKGQPPNAVSKYPMAGLRDVGAITVKMHQESQLFLGGIVDVKAYNINKEQLAVPVKNHSPFANPSLEGLGFTEERLQEWYRAGTGRNIAKEDQGTLKRLVTMLESTKQRVWAAYSSSHSSSYGVREEYRITYTLFEAYYRQLPTPASSVEEEQIGEGSSATHLPFWALDTAALNRFRIADANRWLCCLESILAQTTIYGLGRENSGSLTLDPDQHSPLASAMCRLLNSSLGCHARDRSIWAGKPQRRQKHNTRNGKPRPTPKEGLNMMATIKAFGMMWFPSKTVSGQRILDDQLSPPRVRPSLRQQLAISDTGIQKLFKRKNITLDTTARISVQLATLHWFINQVAQENKNQLASKETRYKVYLLAAEACTQEYCRWMWKILRERWEEHTKIKASGLDLDLRPSDFEAFAIEHGGSKELLDGVVGVGYLQIQSLFATVATIRLVPVQPAGRASKFKSHVLGTWEERIRTLFFPEPKQFGQATLPFVQLAAGFSTVIQRCWGEYQVKEIDDTEWRDYLSKLASSRLLSVLQYDFSTPAVLQKQQKNASVALTSLQRTGLYTAMADPSVCKIYTHNLILQAGAEDNNLQDVCQKPEHVQFLRRLMHHEGGLLIYQQSAKSTRKKATLSQDEPSEADIPAAHGRILRHAVHFEQLGLVKGYSTKSPAPPKLALPKRSLSTTPSRAFDKAFKPYDYIDPEGNRRTLALTEDNLFNSFTNSPIPQIRKRAAFMRQHAYCPHPSHKPTRAPNNPLDLEARKSSENGAPPAHVDFECPDCGIPVYCCEEHWADDYEAHLEVCDVLRQSNEDDHDLRSGRFFKEFQFAEPQMEEILVNMTSWDTYLYTRDYDALNDDREMRQATKLLSYPMTIASVLNELSPYNIRKNGRMTPEGLKSFSALRHTLHPPRTGGGNDWKNARIAPPAVRLFILGARAESSLPRETWMQLSYLFHRVRFSLNFIGPESIANREKELPLPERTLLNPFGAVIEDRISNSMKISTFIEYFHTIHKTGYFYPYDPYFDCFVT